MTRWGLAPLDMRQFIEQVTERGWLKKVDGAGLKLEIGAITEVGAASQKCPMFVFDKIEKYPPGHRVATNVLSTPGRVALALGISPDLSPLDILKEWKDRISNLKPIPPRFVSNAPVLENVLEGDDVDVFKFPVPIWHELDGGPYIGTGDMVITEDPDEHWVNLGTYRCQVHDKKTLGLQSLDGHHCQIMCDKHFARGENAPIAVSFGQAPYLYMVSTTGIPWGLSEYDFAGGMIGRPVEVVKGPITGLPIPACSEIVIEGEVIQPKMGMKTEGPFGEVSGYYSPPRMMPVINVKAVYWRNEPILHGSAPMKPLPGMGHFGIPLSAAFIWSDLEKTKALDVQGVWWYDWFKFLVISVKQRFPGHVKEAALAAMTAGTGWRSGAHKKFVVVVEEDVDVTNLHDVIWAMCMRCDPATQIDIIRDIKNFAGDVRLSPVDRAAGNYVTSSAIIDATRPYYWMKDFAKVNVASPELKKQVMEKWKEALT